MHNFTGREIRDLTDVTPFRVAIAQTPEWAKEEFVRILANTLARGEFPLDVRVFRAPQEEDEVIFFHVLYGYFSNGDLVRDQLRIVVYASRYGNGDTRTLGAGGSDCCMRSIRISGSAT